MPRALDVRERGAQLNRIKALRIRTIFVGAVTHSTYCSGQVQLAKAIIFYLIASGTTFLM